ncbi:hypothetical protein ACWEPC_53450, partial [Nonomuraea sp. NPDC004297]
MTSDPSRHTQDGTQDGAPAAVDWFHPSPDGSLLAFGLSHSGSEQSLASVLDLRTGQVLPDRLTGVRHASLAWLPGGDGFYYSHYPGNRHYGREIRLHLLGTTQHEDPLTWAACDPDGLDWPDVELSPDGRLLLVHVSAGWSGTEAHLLDPRTGERTPLVAAADGKSRLHFTESGAVIGVTSVGAPCGQVVRADPGRGWQVLVPESDLVIDDVSVSDDTLFVTGERDMSSHIGFLDLRADQPMRLAPLPGPGHVAALLPTPGQSVMRNRVVRHLSPTTAVFSWSTPARSPYLAGWDVTRGRVYDLAA